MDMNDNLTAFTKSLEQRYVSEVDGATFSILQPSDHAIRVAAERSMNEAGRVMQSSMARLLLDKAITGWRGVTTKHFGIEGAASPVPFSQTALTALLEQRQDIADELAGTIFVFQQQRREKIEAERKNSESGSSGS